MTPSGVEKLLRALDSERVAFVIIGGAAAVLQGSAYVTNDLDVCYSRERKNLEKLVAALAPLHPSLRAAPKNLPFKLDAATLKSGLNFTFDTDIGDLDLLGEVSGLGDYSAVEALSEEMEIFGMRCKVLTLEGLIKAKRAAGRRKDLLILPELEALLEIRKGQKKD
ncbi:MAG TPA: nucleotidyltransferase [Verrucomicrobiae bacterium]|nr:nucleotidyltransferase [Verrucomicrobiae bacterium]